MKPVRYLWVQTHALDEIAGDGPWDEGSLIDPNHFCYGTREEMEKQVTRPAEWVCFQEIEREELREKKKDARAASEYIDKETELRRREDFDYSLAREWAERGFLAGVKHERENKNGLHDF